MYLMVELYAYCLMNRVNLEIIVSKFFIKLS